MDIFKTNKNNKVQDVNTKNVLGISNKFPTKEERKKKAFPESVQIFLSAKNLANLDSFDDSDPFAVLKHRVKGSEDWIIEGQTETVDNNLNPNWVKSFEVSYDFFKEREIRVDVMDEDDSGEHDLIGYLETTLSKIIKSPN